MGNTIKLVSGFILFVIGVILAYETRAYNLIDILLIVGVIIAIVGIVLIISYFLESSADRTTNMIKEFIESREQNMSSLRGSNKGSNDNNGPLKVRRDYDDYTEYDELNFDDYVRDDDPQNYGSGEFYEPSFEDNPKAVLNVAPQPESEVNFDKQLEFTPNYGKPLKVTRSPKKRKSDYFAEESPEFIVEPVNKTEEIKQALSKEEPVIEPILDTPAPVAPEVAARDIKIDINNPESLPIPKSLNSFVLADDGVLTSMEAFENLAVNVNKEIMLEIPSLNELSDRFLSHVPTIYSRVIINEFDVSDMSYMFLISSLLKQGVHIRTVPKVHATNLITDDSYAMIISEGSGNMEYGAIYNDRNSISSIRADFEKTWNMASSLDENILMANVPGGVA